MKSWLHIRDTGVNILEILELLSKGGLCSEISGRFPGVSHRDLARAARAILSYMTAHIPADILCATSGDPALRRPANLNDGLPWTAAEDDELRRLVRYHVRISAAARLLRRSEQAVKKRLEEMQGLPR